MVVYYIVFKWAFFEVSFLEFSAVFATDDLLLKQPRHKSIFFWLLKEAGFLLLQTSG